MHSLGYESFFQFRSATEMRVLGELLSQAAARTVRKILGVAEMTVGAALGQHGGEKYRNVNSKLGAVLVGAVDLATAGGGILWSVEAGLGSVGYSVSHLRR